MGAELDRSLRFLEQRYKDLCALQPGSTYLQELSNLRLRRPAKDSLDTQLGREVTFLLGKIHINCT